MGLLKTVLQIKLMENVNNLLSAYSLCNILFALGVVLISCLCLRRSAAEDFYAFRIRDMVCFSILLLFSMVFVVQPFPFWKNAVLGCIALAVCSTVLAITSVMDEKSGYFVLGYMAVGVFAEIVLIIACLIARKVSPDALLVLGVALVVIWLQAIVFHCYTVGDAGLLTMVALCQIVMLAPKLWVISLVCTMFVAYLTFVLRYVFCIREIMKKRKVQLPFTVHIFVGFMVTMFLFS